MLLAIINYYWQRMNFSFLQDNKIRNGLVIFKVLWSLVAFSVYLVQLWLGLLASLVYVGYYFWVGQAQWRQLLALTLLGCILDYLNLTFGVFTIVITPYNIFGFSSWLILLWLVFAIFILDVYNKIVTNRGWYYIIIGMSGWLAYHFGVTIGFFAFATYGSWVLLLEWCLIVPTMCVITQYRIS